MRRPAGVVIDELLEPRPTRSRRSAPEEHARRSAEPAFIAVRLRLEPGAW